MSETEAYKKLKTMAENKGLTNAFDNYLKCDSLDLESA